MSTTSSPTHNAQYQSGPWQVTSLTSSLNMRCDAGQLGVSAMQTEAGTCTVFSVLHSNATSEIQENLTREVGTLMSKVLPQILIRCSDTSPKMETGSETGTLIRRLLTTSERKKWIWRRISLKRRSRHLFRLSLLSCPMRCWSPVLQWRNNGTGGLCRVLTGVRPRGSTKPLRASEYLWCPHLFTDGRATGAKKFVFGTTPSPQEKTLSPPLLFGGCWRRFPGTQGIHVPTGPERARESLSYFTTISRDISMTLGSEPDLESYPSRL